jgi:hypothetical protein
MVPLLSSEDVQNAGTMESVTFTKKTSLTAGSTYQICGVNRYLYTQSVTVQLIM